jgi:aminoglycoside/choline kinase family phosphotransferase
MQLPDEATLAWVEGIVGPFRVVSRFAHDHGYSQLWRIEVGSDYVWLKMHAHPHKWAGEVHALTQWTDPLAPALLAWREDPASVLLSEMPGGDAESIAFDGPAEERLWAQAGDWLRAFHARTNDWLGNVRADGSPHDAPTNDPCAHVQKNFEKRLFQGREDGILDEKEFAFAQSLFNEGLPSLEGAAAHSIHRDFHPRNWLARPDGTLTAVIDFEHARWDVRAADLNRPWDKEFNRNPRLIDAFYEAYGRPDDRFMAQIQTLRLYNVMTGVVWAVEVGDLPFSEFNRAALRRMMGA